MAKLLKYKGIVFDDYVQDFEWKNCWAEICDKCFAKYKDKFEKFDTAGSGIGCCGVKGCTSESAGIYVDFGLDVEITEEEE